MHVLRRAKRSCGVFCDGRSAPAEFARFAIANHFRAYGFSSHAPLPFETFWNMTKDDMPEYLQEIGRLKDKHKEQLEIYVGLEIDYLDPTYNASIPYFRALPLDYRIGSIHFLPLAWPLAEKNMMCIDGSYEEFAHSVDQHYQGDIRLLVGHYFRSLREMLEAGGIDIVGHMDKIFMNGQRYKGFDMTANWYLDPLMECLERNAWNWSRKRVTSWRSIPRTGSSVMRPTRTSNTLRRSVSLVSRLWSIPIAITQPLSMMAAQKSWSC